MQHSIPVILIFDIGKTNKKLFLFDENYRLAWEQMKRFPEIEDEDNFPCEDLAALTNWMQESYLNLLLDKRFSIKAINFSGYGASFVHLDKNGAVLLPLYNYLKPYKDTTRASFFAKYGPILDFCKQTASPLLDSLNAGLQLHRLKIEKPLEYAQIKHSLHLPQYLSYIFSEKCFSDITSIGCHTMLWNFEQNNYHNWVTAEDINSKLAAIKKGEEMGGYTAAGIAVGIGLHDSSAALIPYLYFCKEPFLLISTGSWCISLNPFNQQILTAEELAQDCLCYLSYAGNPIKAARIFAGHEHEMQIKKLSLHFNKNLDYYTTLNYDTDLIEKLKNQESLGLEALTNFNCYEEAYHQLMINIVAAQVRSTNLVLKGTAVKKIFIDGGFSQNPIYMHLLTEAFFPIAVYAASVPQASALGAALVLHETWNTKPLSVNKVQVTSYFFEPPN